MTENLAVKEHQQIALQSVNRSPERGIGNCYIKERQSSIWNVATHAGFNANWWVSAIYYPTLFDIILSTLSLTRMYIPPEPQLLFMLCLAEYPPCYERFIFVEVHTDLLPNKNYIHLKFEIKKISASFTCFMSAGKFKHLLETLRFCVPCKITTLSLFFCIWRSHKQILYWKGLKSKLQFYRTLILWPILWLCFTCKCHQCDHHPHDKEEN